MFRVPPGKTKLARILPAVLAVLLAWALPSVAMEVMDAPELTEVSARTGITINIPQATGIHIDSTSYLGFWAGTGVPSYGNGTWLTLDDMELYQYNSGALGNRTAKIPITNMTLDSTAAGLVIGLPAFSPGISLSSGDLKMGNVYATPEGAAGGSFGRFELGNVVMPAGTLTISGGTGATVGIPVEAGNNEGIRTRFQTRLGSTADPAFLAYQDDDGFGATYNTAGWLVLGGLTLDNGTDNTNVDLLLDADLGTTGGKTYARFRIPATNPQQRFRIRATNIGLDNDQIPEATDEDFEMGLNLVGSIQVLFTDLTTNKAWVTGNGSGGRFGLTDTTGALNGSYGYIYDSDGYAAYAAGAGYIAFNNAFLVGGGGVAFPEYNTNGSLDGISLGAGNNGATYVFGGDRTSSSQIDVGFDLQTSSTNNFGALGNANTLLGFRGNNVTFPPMQIYFTPLDDGVRLFSTPPVAFLRLGDKTQVGRFGGIYDADGETLHGSGCTGAGYWVLDRFDLGFYGNVDLNVGYSAGLGYGAAQLSSTNLEMKFFSNSFFNSTLASAGAKELGILDISIPFSSINATIRAH